MDVAFPFGFPFATGWYLTLYVVTLVVHVVFMNYVLAGTGYLAFVSIVTGGPNLMRHRRPTAVILRDWMPFALGATITAGVAPLLFIQILYKKQFYTANLLLFHRWMSILPVLIIGFYLLYLLKSRVISRWSLSVRALVGVGAFLCFAFTAYSWTENHLLSTQPAVWAEFYGSEKMVYWNPLIVPRLGVWFVGAIPTLCAILVWQLRGARGRAEESQAAELRRLATLALGGLILTIVFAGWYYTALDATARAQLTGPLAVPYLIAAIVGLGMQFTGWVGLWRSASWSARRPLLVSIGVFVTILGMNVVREALRLASIDITALVHHHVKAAQVGGVFAFLFFLGLMVLLIAWCVRLVRRGTVPETPRGIEE